MFEDLDDEPKRHERKSKFKDGFDETLGKGLAHLIVTLIGVLFMLVVLGIATYIIVKWQTDKKSDSIRQTPALSFSPPHR